MPSREHAIYGVSGPIYVNENFARQEILAVVYLNETVVHTPPLLITDYHDGEEDNKKRDEEIKRFREKNEQLREDLVSAYNRNFGISVPDEAEPAEMVQAIEENFQQISKQDSAEIEKRVLEKLVKEYHEYEQEKRIYDHRMLENEWDNDIMLVLTHILQ